MNCLRSSGHAEFPVESRKAGFDVGWRYALDLGDLFVRVSEGKKTQQMAFLLREAGWSPLIRTQVSELRENPVSSCAVEHGPSGRYGFDGLYKVSGADAFRNEAVCPGSDGLIEGIDIMIRGEKENSGPGGSGQNFAAGFNS